MSAERVELELPGVTTEELRAWASNVAGANPINSTLTSDEGLELRITDLQFMGVELTFMCEDRALLTLALFADHPNEQEREIMETENVWAAGL